MEGAATNDANTVREVLRSKIKANNITVLMTTFTSVQVGEVSILDNSLMRRVYVFNTVYK